MAEAPLQRGQGARVDVGGEREVLIVGQPQVIRQADLGPVRGRHAEVGHQQAARRAFFRAIRNREHRKQRQGDAEDRQPTALETQAPADGIARHPRGADRPARLARAARRGGHRARRVDRLVEPQDAIGSRGALRRDAAAAFEHHEEILDRPVAQLVVEHDAVADHAVAFGREDDDIAERDDAARVAVPLDAVGGEVIAVAVHPHLALGDDQRTGVVIADAVGAEIDLVGRGGSGRGGRRAARARQIARGRCPPRRRAGAAPWRAPMFDRSSPTFPPGTISRLRLGLSHLARQAANRVLKADFAKEPAPA